MMRLSILPGLARDIAVGADGAIWKVDADGRVAHLEGTSWHYGAEAEERALRIAVHRDGSPWVVGESGRVHRLQNGRWHIIPAHAVQLSATAVSDGMVMVDESGRLHEWDESAHQWLELLHSPHDAVEAAAHSLSNIWYVRRDGGLAIWAGEVLDPSGRGLALSFAPGESDTPFYLLDEAHEIWRRDHEADRWVGYDVDRGAIRLAAHPDGSLLIVDADGRTHWLTVDEGGAGAD